MGRHNSRRRSSAPAAKSRPRYAAARVALALIAVALLVTGVVAVLRPNALRPAAAAPCQTSTKLTVVTSSSFAPVLKDMAPALLRDPECLRLDVHVVDGRMAIEHLPALHADVWIPDDGAWAMNSGSPVDTADMGGMAMPSAPEAPAPGGMVMPSASATAAPGGMAMPYSSESADPGGMAMPSAPPMSSASPMASPDAMGAMQSGLALLAPRGQGGAHTVLATSPIYQVADESTAKRITDAGGTWAGLSALLVGGSGIRLVVREPADSGDGMVAFASLGETVWMSKGMDSATEASVATRRVSRSPAGVNPALPFEPGEVGLVPEYALLPLLDTRAERLTVLTGADRTAMLRFTWLPLTTALADPHRAAALDRLRRALMSTSADGAVGAAGLRRPGEGPPPGAPSGRLPHLAAKAFDEIAPHHIDHMFAVWYPTERKANLLVVVDVSGSMAAPARGTKTPLIRLVANGCGSVGDLLPDNSRLGLWEFGSRLDPPRDYRVLLPSGQLTGVHRKALATVVGKLAAQPTGTGLFDTILAAYRNAVASYQPGMTNQVLVFTDALNEDDPGGITVGQLSGLLKASAKQGRPVSIEVAKFGSQPLNVPLKKALATVSGSLISVNSAQQVEGVFVHAVVGGMR